MDSVTKCQRQLENARTHAWTRQSREYVRTPMDYHRINRIEAVVLEIGEIVLIVGVEKNRGLWMKGKVSQHDERKSPGEAFAVHWKSEVRSLQKH